MGWANIANAGSYADALAMPVTTPNYPDITLTRQVRTNYGFVANLEQAITSDLGVFSRATWSPGLVEIIGWTDCDEEPFVRHGVKGQSLGDGRMTRLAWQGWSKVSRPRPARTSLPAAWGF